VSAGGASVDVCGPVSCQLLHLFDLGHGMCVPCSSSRLSGGVAQDAHVKRLKRLAAEHEEAVKSAHAAHLVRMHKAAALELTEREAVGGGHRGLGADAGELCVV
jgi:hypothetical protein